MPEPVESPVSSTSPSGGSAPSSSGNITTGTASASLLAAAQAAETEGAAPSAATEPAAKPAGDTSGTPPAKEVAVQPNGQPQNGQPPADGKEGAPRNPELEQQFTRVARNAQAKVLDALGLKGIRYDQIPAIAKQIGVARNILADLQKDPRDFANRLIAELDTRDGGKPKSFTLPDGRLMAEDGKTRVYSQEQIISEVVPAIEQMITQKLLNSGALSKVINYVDQEHERRAQDETAKQRTERQSKALTEMRAKPHFKEHEQKIVHLISAWNEVDPAGLRAKGIEWALQAAYNEVLAKDVYGTNYRATVESEVREEMKKKAAGGSSSPAADAGRSDGKPKELRNVTDLAERMRQMAAAS